MYLLVVVVVAVADADVDADVTNKCLRCLQHFTRCRSCHVRFVVAFVQFRTPAGGNTIPKWRTFLLERLHPPGWEL